jgi:hypothetical protein
VAEAVFDDANARFVCLPLYLRTLDASMQREGGLHCNALVLDLRDRCLLRFDPNGFRSVSYLPLDQ